MASKKSAPGAGGATNDQTQTFLNTFETIAFSRCAEEWEKLTELQRSRALKQNQLSTQQRKLAELVSSIQATVHELAAIDDQIALTQDSIRLKDNQTQGQLKAMLAEWENMQLSEGVSRNKDVEQRHQREVAVLRSQLEHAVAAKQALDRQLQEVEVAHEEQLLASQYERGRSTDRKLLTSGSLGGSSATPSAVQASSRRPATESASRGGGEPLTDFGRDRTGGSRVREEVIGGATSPNSSSQFSNSSASISVNGRSQQTPWAATQSYSQSQSVAPQSQKAVETSNRPPAVEVSLTDLVNTDPPSSAKDRRPAPQESSRPASSASTSAAPTREGPQVLGTRLARKEVSHGTVGGGAGGASASASVRSSSAGLDSSTIPTTAGQTPASAAAPDTEDVVEFNMGFEVSNRRERLGSNGVLVRGVQEASAAWKAGLRANDIILQWGETRTNTVADLRHGIQSNGDLVVARVVSLNYTNRSKSAESDTPNTQGGAQVPEKLGPLRCLMMRVPAGSRAPTGRRTEPL
jgi:hypothetical protein